ncbi:MAG: cation:proton antiporter [Thermodesulfobacteriota bacterium]
MENIPILKDLVIIMAVSVPISILLTRAGLPTIIGFLLTGVIIGPYGLGLITEMHSVEVLSQVGIVLLLFTIGLEFSVVRLLNLKRIGIIGGGLQVGITTTIVLLIGLYWGKMLPTALLLGFVISLSSTAIVLKLLTEKGELNSPHGYFSVGVLLFQDICMVLMFMVVQSIGTGAPPLEAAKKLAISFGAFGAIVVAVAYIIPRIFKYVVRLRNREVFILTIVLVCMGTAWLTSLFGLSLAIGAFIAGLAVSESEYSNQIVAEVVPFRDTLASLFFISIGMLLDFKFFMYNIPWLLALVAGIIILKTITIIGVGQILKYPLRLSIVVGLNLAQIGEFSFILIKMGQDYGLMDRWLYQSLLAASIVSMAVTPFIYKRSSRLAFEAGHLLGKKASRKEPKRPAPSNHVIIIGYGINGSNLARVLKETAIPHAILEVNMDRVNKAKKEGHKAFFGDASHPEILKGVGIEKAKMVVVSIANPIITRRVLRLSRDLNPALTIVVRTRYIREVEELYKLGADQVIPEEFETSVEIFARVLRDYRIPSNIIQNQIDFIREEGYAMLRAPSPAPASERLTRLTAIFEASLMDTYYVEGGCSVEGKTIDQLNMRKVTGATIIAVIRKGKAQTNPRADFKIAAGDIIVLLGSHAELNSAIELLKISCPI